MILAEYIEALRRDAEDALRKEGLIQEKERLNESLLRLKSFLESQAIEEINPPDLFPKPKPKPIGGWTW